MSDTQSPLEEIIKWEEWKGEQMLAGRTAPTPEEYEAELIQDATVELLQKLVLHPVESPQLFHEAEVLLERLEAIRAA